MMQLMCRTMTARQTKFHALEAPAAQTELCPHQTPARLCIHVCSPALYISCSQDMHPLRTPFDFPCLYSTGLLPLCIFFAHTRALVLDRMHTRRCFFLAQFFLHQS